MKMNPIVSHVAVPSLLTALFFFVASTPVEVFGCFARGLIALLIAGLGLLGGLAAAIMAVKQKITGNHKGHWWIATALFLSVPAAALLFLA